MNIPIEIIVLFLTTVFGAIAALITILLSVVNKNTEAWKSIGKTVDEILKHLAVKDTEDKYESEKCETTHGYIKNKLSDHTKRLDTHEKLFESHGHRISHSENELQDHKKRIVFLEEAVT